MIRGVFAPATIHRGSRVSPHPAPATVPAVGNFIGLYGQKLSTSVGNFWNWYNSAGDTGNALAINATGGRNGRAAMQVQQTATGASATVGFNPFGTEEQLAYRTGNVITFFAWLNVLQLPTTGSASLLQTSGLNTNPGIQLTTAGVLRAFAGTNVSPFSGTFQTNNWYFVAARIDTSTGQYRLDWTVYDSSTGIQTNETSVLSNLTTDAIVPVATVRFGNNASGGQLGDSTHVGALFQDMGYAIGDVWPIAPMEVIRLNLTAVGNHNLAAGSFQTTSAVAITGGDTTSYQAIDETPPNGGDYVSQTQTDTTAYLEYVFESLSAKTSFDPISVKIYAEYQGSATGAYGVELRAFDGAHESTDLLVNGVKSATTLADRAIAMPYNITGDPWRVAAMDNFRIRFGYSSDVTPNPQLNSVFAEVLVPLSSAISYTESDTASYVLTASAVESHEIPDSDTGAFVLTAGGTDIHEIPDSDTAAFVLTGSGTEIHTISDADVAFNVLSASASDTSQYLESGTAAYLLVGSATEVHEIPDAATGAWVLTASATDTQQFVESSTGVWVLTASSAEVHTISDAATAAYVLTASATDTQQFVESATAAYVLTASGTDTQQFVDSNTAAWLLTTSAAEVHTISDAATASWVMTPVASPNTLWVNDTFTRTITAAVNTTMGTPDLNYGAYAGAVGPGWLLGNGATTTPVGVNGSQGTIQAPSASSTIRTQQIDGQPNDVEILTRVSLDLTPTGATTLLRVMSRVTGTQNYYYCGLNITTAGAVTLRLAKLISNSLTILNDVASVLTGYTGGTKIWVRFRTVGSNFFAKIWYDGNAEPANWQNVYFGDTDIPTATQLGIGLNNGTSSSTAETLQIDDFQVYAVNTESAAYVDSDTPAWVLTPSGTDVHTIPDADTAFNVYTAITVVEFKALVDAGTAAYVLTASATENAQFSDSNTASYVLTAGGTESRDIVDSGTAAYVLTASAADVAADVDANTGAFVLTASATDQAAYVESQTAAWVLTAYPNAAPQILLHDTFSRSTSTDWGTSDNGITYQHVSGVAANMNVVTDHGRYLQASGAGGTYRQFAQMPHTDIRVRATLSVSVLTSQVSGQSYFYGIRLRSDAIAGGNAYEFRFNLNTAGNITSIVTRVDSGTSTTLLSGSTVYAAGTWATSDLFVFEAVAVGSRLELWIYKTTDGRPSTPTRTYDISSDGTQYYNGAGIMNTALSNGAPTADEEYDVWALDAWALTEVEASVDTGTPAWTMTASAVEGRESADSTTAANVYTASAAETREIPDSGTGAWVMTAGGSESQFTGISDTGTAAWVMTTSGTELHTTVDTSTASWVMTGSATTELHTILDAATSSAVFTAGGTEQWIAAESATAQYVLTGSGTQSFAGLDSTTGSWVLSAISFEEFGKIDSGTASYVLTASGTETRQMSDAATVQYFQTAITAAEFLVYDADTAIWQFDVSAVEGLGLTEADSGIWHFEASGFENSDYVDASQGAVIFYTGALVESLTILDYYLEAVQSHRWDASQIHRWTATQMGHYVVSQTRRWNVIYKGRGFLSG